MIERSTIILLCGQGGVGKSTSAEYIKHKLLQKNYTAEIIGLDGINKNVDVSLVFTYLQLVSDATNKADRSDFIICDQAHDTIMSRKRIIDVIVNPNRFNLICIGLHPPFETIIQRLPLDFSELYYDKIWSCYQEYQPILELEFEQYNFNSIKAFNLEGNYNLTEIDFTSILDINF